MLILFLCHALIRAPDWPPNSVVQVSSFYHRPMHRPETGPTHDHYPISITNYNSGHRPSWPAHLFSHILLPAVFIFHIPPNRPSSSTLALFAFHNPCNFQLHPPKPFFVHHIANTSASQVGSVQRPTQTSTSFPICVSLLLEWHQTQIHTLAISQVYTHPIKRTILTHMAILKTAIHWPFILYQLTFNLLSTIPYTA